MKHWIALAGLLMVSFFSFAQVSVSGKVKDALNNAPLAFVNIVSSETGVGCTSDIDGRFAFKSQSSSKQLKISFVGYETVVYNITSNTSNLLIKLTPKDVELSEVTIKPGLNPAHRIINQVIANRTKNNYENLPEFSYTSYEKTIFTVNPDSLLQMNEAMLDSSDLKLKRFLQKRDFMLIENVIEKNYMAPHHKLEKVVASRISGFRDPIFMFLLNQLQSSSFYDEVIKIADKNYINPISNGSLNKYYFQLEDTLVEGIDTVFVLSYRPFLNTNFDGLKGVMQISTLGWAIKNVIAEPNEETDGFSIKIQQLYQQLPAGQWFPVQMNTDLILNMAQVQAGKRNLKMIAQGKAYIKDINLSPGLKKRQFGHIEVEVEPESSQRDEMFWNTYRIDSLGLRELETYRFIDSIGQKHRFDRMASLIETLINGKIPLGYVDMDINKLLRYNSFEGFYVGIGLETSNKISQKLKLGGYWGYGFKDQTAKYGGFGSWLINRHNDISLKYSYRYDVIESGGTDFFDSKKNLSSGDYFRDLLVNRMDYIQGHKAQLAFRTLRYVMVYLGGSVETKTPGYEYIYLINKTPQKRFHFTEIQAGFRWVYGEKFLLSARSKLALATDYPVVQFKFTKGITAIDGGYNYTRYDFSASKSFYVKYLGKTTLKIDAGLAQGDVPASNLFNAKASYGPLTLYSPGSFTTMRLNEFYSDKFIAGFLSHDFGKLLGRSKYLQPEFELTTNALIGSLSNASNHQGIVMQAPSLGYFESGIYAHKLLNMGFYTLGLGSAYRYGAYSLPKTLQNFTFVFTMKFKL
jgi:hypothetical protein